MSFQIIPTIFLRGVDVKKINQKYTEGNYSHFSLQNVPQDRVVITEGLSSASSCYSEDRMDRLYRYKNNSSRYVVFAYSNQELFARFFSRQQKFHGLRCDWCRKELQTNESKNSGEITEQTVVGIPYKKTQQTVLVPENCQQLTLNIDHGAFIPTNNRSLEDFSEEIKTKTLEQQARFVSYTVYYCMDKFCSFNCALAYLRVYQHTDRIYDNKERLLREYFRTCYPNKKLKAAQHWKLLARNGGSLTEEEYYHQHYTYQPTTNVVVVPVKVGFVRMSEQPKKTKQFELF